MITTDYRWVVGTHYGEQKRTSPPNRLQAVVLAAGKQSETRRIPRQQFLTHRNI